jgi:hypothetical protein
VFIFSWMGSRKSKEVYCDKCQMTYMADETGFLVFPEVGDGNHAICAQCLYAKLMEPTL